MNHWNLWFIVIHTDTFLEVIIPTRAVVVLLDLVKHFFAVSKIKKSQHEHPGRFLIAIETFCLSYGLCEMQRAMNLSV